MSDYLVAWEIDISAETPRAAAEKAREAQCPGSSALVFKVYDGSIAAPETIDLLEEPEPMQTLHETDVKDMTPETHLKLDDMLDELDQCHGDELESRIGEALKVIAQQRAMTVRPFGPGETLDAIEAALTGQFVEPVQTSHETKDPEPPPAEIKAGNFLIVSAERPE